MQIEILCISIWHEVKLRQKVVSQPWVHLFKALIAAFAVWSSNPGWFHPTFVVGHSLPMDTSILLHNFQPPKDFLNYKCMKHHQQLGNVNFYVPYILCSDGFVIFHEAVY